MDTHESALALGQQRILATLALGVALLSFLNLAGLEKAILAIVLGIKALSPSLPAALPPALEPRRSRARVAIGLAGVHIFLVVMLFVLNLDRISRFVDALRTMPDLR